MRFFIASLMMLFSTTALSQSITIDAGAPGYSSLPAVQGVNISSEVEVRIAAMTQLLGVYQSLHGMNSIPIASSFTVKYDDGSSEKASRVCFAGSACAMPIPGTRKNADGSSADTTVSGGGGGGGGGAGGGSNVGRDIIGAGSPNAGNVIVKPLITKDP